MGLDVYLYHCPDRKIAKEAEENYQAQTEALWEAAGGWDKATKEQKKEIKKKSKELAKTLGCTGLYDTYHTVSKIEIDSKLYPEHMYKIGYFRSSYNSGGIERILEQFEVPGLHDIFKPGEDYEVFPNWEEALKIANEAISKYQAHLTGPGGDLQMMKVGPNMFADLTKLPQSEQEALRLIKEELKRKDKSPFGGGYSNATGEFYWEGLQVVAFIPGMDSILGKRPCVYVAYRIKEPGKVQEVVDKLDRKEKDWYFQALEVTRETIHYVLEQPDPQNYYLHWSS